MLQPHAPVVAGSIPGYGCGWERSPGHLPQCIRCIIEQRRASNNVQLSRAACMQASGALGRPGGQHCCQSLVEVLANVALFGPAGCAGSVNSWHCCHAICPQRDGHARCVCCQQRACLASDGGSFFVAELLLPSRQQCSFPHGGRSRAPRMQLCSCAVVLSGCDAWPLLERLLCSCLMWRIRMRCWQWHGQDCLWCTDYLTAQRAEGSTCIYISMHYDVPCRERTMAASGSAAESAVGTLACVCCDT